MNLSENFTLEEMTHSNIADEEGIDNSLCPERDAKKIASLEALCKHVLQLVRTHYGKAITPNSGYRCRELNNHPRMKGSPTSQHMDGEAVDFVVPGVSCLEVAHYIATHITFDHLILENYDEDTGDAEWVHVSFRRNDVNCQNVVTKGITLYSPGLPAWPVSDK